MSRTLLLNPTAMEAGLLAAAKVRAKDPARAEAFERFAKTGLPHRRLEGWKWTDLRAALREKMPAATPAEDVIAPSVFIGAKPYEIAVMNGRAIWNEPPPSGVTITRAPDADLPMAAADHPLANLAAAFAEERVEIAVAAAARIGRPILLRRIAGGGVAHGRVMIALGKGALATVIESFDGAGRYFSNSTTEILLDEGASLTRILLQDGSEEGVETSLASATLAANAQFEQTALLLGAKTARVETRIACLGDHARASLTSAAALSGDRHADLTSHVSHDARNCTTRQLHKMALTNRAQGVFQGKFLVARGAQKTDAQMRAAALLLSREAEANHKPELEIYADDVACGHGATAGALDEDALFYLKSRGLPDAEARALLVDAFLVEALSGIKHVGLEETFRARMHAFLGGAR